MFLQEYTVTILILLLFSYAGYFATYPFCKTFRNFIYASPLIGLFFIILGVSILYNLFSMSVKLSLILSLISCGLLSTSVIFFNKNSVTINLFRDKSIIFFILGFTALITYLTNQTSIHLGVPGFLYMDGTDHLGYAHVADWLNNHLALVRPVADPSVPYESWPEMMYTWDHRFGSYFSLAILSLLQNQTGMFAYDNACAIVLCAGIFAVGAVFSDSKKTFAFLCLALLTTFWLGYSRQGYFGKILAYPGILFVSGIYLLRVRPFSNLQLIILSCLAAAVTSMHSPFSVGIIFGSIGCVYLVWKILVVLTSRQFGRLKETLEDLLMFCFIVGIIFLVTGVLVGPTYLNISNVVGLPFTLNWQKLFPILFELENPGPPVTRLSTHFLLLLVSLTFFIVLFLQRTAFSIRNYPALALLSTPLVILFSFLILDFKWQSYQLVGILFPAILLGGFVLVQNIKNNKQKYFLVIIMLSLISIFHFPRIIGDVKRYAGRGSNRALKFSQKDFEILQKFIKNNKVLLDIRPETNYTLPFLVSLGASSNLKFSVSNWQSVVGYRRWKAPENIIERYKIVYSTNQIASNCNLLYHGRQFYLIDCKA